VGALLRGTLLWLLYERKMSHETRNILTLYKSYRAASRGRHSVSTGDCVPRRIPKKADAATKLVTKTFSNSALISIPEGAVFSSGSCTSTDMNIGVAAPYPSEKGVSAFPAGSRIKDINFTLKNYSHHDFPDDVDVLLAHAGKNRTVMSDVGGTSDVSNITLVLDDEANSALPNSGQLVGGSFKPTNFETGDGFPAPAPSQDNRSALSGFEGQNPNKIWRLFVQDDATSDCGKVGGGWSITIKAVVPA